MVSPDSTFEIDVSGLYEVPVPDLSIYDGYTQLEDGFYELCYVVSYTITQDGLEDKFSISEEGILTVFTSAPFTAETFTIQF